MLEHLYIPKHGNRPVIASGQFLTHAWQGSCTHSQPGLLIAGKCMHRVLKCATMTHHSVVFPTLLSFISFIMLRSSQFF